MRLPHVPPALVGRPFTRAQARAAGLTDSALRGREWRQLFRNVWLHTSVADTREMRIAAVRLILPPHAVVCGLTAAWLYGADVRRDDDLDVHVAYPPGRRRRKRPGLVVTEVTFSEGDVVTIDGITLTSATRTTFDCLRQLRHPMGLVVADALTHLQRCTVAEISDFVLTHRSIRNVRVAERLVPAIEPATESPMETRLRVTLVDGGLPRPVAQFELRDGRGRFVARLDFAYPQCRVAVEYDGAWHFGRRREDDRRRDAVRALGWIVIVVSADDIYGNAAGVCARVAAALESSVERDALGVIQAK